MKKKRVLITGGEGFIGSHLTEFFLKKNYKVISLVHYNSFNNIGWLKDIRHKNLKVISGDINDALFCNNVTKKIDIIYNLAALISIPYSYVAPEVFLNTNIKGTYNICNAALQNKVKRIIHVSSSEVYGSLKYSPIDEKHPLQPQSPYSATKISSEAIAMSFYYTHNLNVSIARPFNTFGPRQSLRAVIPTIIFQSLKGNKIKLGDLETKRNFNYIGNTCLGLFSLIKNNQTIGNILNIGSDDVLKIDQVVKIVSKKLNKKLIVLKDNKRLRPKKSEVRALSCNYKKIKKITGYKPSVSFENGISKTIEWCKKNIHTNVDEYII